MSSLDFYARTNVNTKLDKRYIESFQWRHGASIDTNRWPSFADSRGRMVISARMPGLTSTKIASWQYIEVRVLSVVIYRCAIASYGLGRGLRTYELELQALSSYRLARGADFLAGATSRTMKAHSITAASDFTYFDHVGEYTGFSRGIELIQNIERFAFCMILPKPAADGFDLVGLPFTTTEIEASLIIQPKYDSIPESSFHSAIRDWRRDQAVMNQRVETRPREQTIRWDTDWDRTTYFQVGSKWTHRLDFGLFLRSRGERRPITDIDDDKGDLIFNPPISGSYSVNAITSTGRIFVSGLSQRLRGKVRVTVEYRLGENTVSFRPQSYGTIVGTGLGRVEPSRIASNDKASNIDAALKRLNTFRPRVYNITFLPDIVKQGFAGQAFSYRPPSLCAFIHGGIKDLCIIVRAEISQRGSRPAQLRLALVRLKPYTGLERFTEATPVLYGSRRVRFDDDIGFTTPPLIRYDDKVLRFNDKGIIYG